MTIVITRAPTHRRTPHAFVLLAVLVVVIMSAMIVASLMFRMRAEELASHVSRNNDQARAAALSGLYATMRFLTELKPGSRDTHNNPDVFQNQFLYDDGAERWYYTVFTRGLGEDAPMRYGLTDEAGKLNILEAGAEELAKLPQMTTARVDGLIDFLDGDTQPGGEGAEQDYYDDLPHPYFIRDGDLATLEELLLVRGLTPQLLFGEDANLNFRLDPNEDDGDEQFPPDNANGNLNHGFFPWLTVRSYDPNVTDEGYARINLNDPEESFNEEDFPETLITYIKELRKAANTLSDPVELLEAKLTVKDEGTGADREIESGVTADLLALVLDRFKTTDDERRPGLININTAPLEVLLTLPGVDLSLAETIISTRRGLDALERRSTAWLLQKEVLEAGQFRALAPRLTARSFQYRFHVVGFSRPGGAFVVLDAVVDLGSGTPKVSYLRDLTRLGLPFQLVTEDTLTDG